MAKVRRVNKDVMFCGFCRKKTNHEFFITREVFQVECNACGHIKRLITNRNERTEVIEQYA